jgi:2-keto-4-pentenoate hydratase/2-oxohepta-3-ene-1,7-dioic acid hydratase in catechol pathway
MQLVTYRVPGEAPRLGALAAGDVIDLPAAVALFEGPGAAANVPNRLPRLLDGGPAQLDRVRRAVDHALALAPDAAGPWGRPARRRRAEVRLEPPFLPRAILCGGANFKDHLEELGRERPEHLEFFLKSPFSVIGPEDPIAYQPWVSEKLDYEVEIGIVIGRAGRCIPPEHALDYVAGYTVANDLAARDRQILSWAGPLFHLRYGEGKSFDSGCVLGPCVVTRDEVPDPNGLTMRTWVNGELRQNNNTANMLWDVAGAVSYYSTYMTLLPGFLILPGTPGGCAVGSDPAAGGRPGVRHPARPRYLRPGDRVRCEVGGVCAVENVVVEVTPETYAGAAAWLDWLI